MWHGKDVICMPHNWGEDTDTYLQYVILSIVNSSAEYFVAGQQCTGNPLLHFHGNNEHFCIVHSNICASNNKKGTYGCLYVVTGYTNIPQCNVVVCMLSALFMLILLNGRRQQYLIHIFKMSKCMFKSTLKAELKIGLVVYNLYSWSDMVK